MKGSNMELAEREDPPKKRMNWIVGGVLLGLLNTYAVASYGALGASRNYAVVDSFLLRLFGTDLASTNSYLSQLPTRADWLLMLALGMVIGGFLAAVVTGTINSRSGPRLRKS